MRLQLPPSAWFCRKGKERREEKRAKGQKGSGMWWWWSLAGKCAEGGKFDVQEIGFWGQLPRCLAGGAAGGCQSYL